MKAVVLGASGYTGMVLVRLLETHPHITSIIPVSSSKIGNPLDTGDPGLGLISGAKCLPAYVSLDQARKEQPDIVFSCLPHLASAETCAEFIGKTVIIDLSADFRLEDPADFRTAYGCDPPKPQYQKQAVYGLPELYRDQIKKYDLIANPGCYPTASLLPLVPFLKHSQGKIIINALSGISGAGKKLTENLMFCERTENAGAYLPGKEHRHAAEICKEIRKAAGTDRPTLFTPHLIPAKRGMTATINIELKKSMQQEEAGEILTGFYGSSPFIRVRSSGIPQSADTRGSNRCDIGFRVFDRELMLFSSIDNLLKGASGMAVQNMNIRFGYDETAGLPVHNQL
ncbi:MAG: N-acetyl-gamma-glutamyl-phosphate reductase [Spirochaetales bacterium]|nr:N-acetyl-gamma-glutamyl-phosphate reductase [Spirochaetales bacterium]